MSKLKRIKNLEAFIDAVIAAREVVGHNRIETEHLLDRELQLQEHYKKLTGDYYHYREKADDRKVYKGE